MIKDYNQDFIPRMSDPKDLTLQECVEMVEWLSQTPIGIDGILNMRLAFQQVKTLLETQQAIERFNVGSARLTKWLIWLTVVLVILTIAIAWFTILLWKRS